MADEQCRPVRASDPIHAHGEEHCLSGHDVEPVHLQTMQLCVRLGDRGRVVRAWCIANTAGYAVGRFENDDLALDQPIEHVGRQAVSLLGGCLDISNGLESIAHHGLLRLAIYVIPT